MDDGDDHACSLGTTVADIWPAQAPAKDNRLVASTPVTRTDPAAVATAFAAAGMNLNDDDAVCIARGIDDQGLPPPTAGLDTLTPQQQEAALELLIQCSPRTVEEHLRTSFANDLKGTADEDQVDCIVGLLLSHPDLPTVIRHSVAGTIMSEDCLVILFEIFGACT